MSEVKRSHLLKGAVSPEVSPDFNVTLDTAPPTPPLTSSVTESPFKSLMPREAYWSYIRSASKGVFTGDQLRRSIKVLCGAWRSRSNPAANSGCPFRRQNRAP